METKQCNKCGETKIVDLFNKRYGKPQPYCRECNRSYHKDHYKRNKAVYKQDTADRRWQLRANGLQRIMEHAKDGCVECGEKDFRCLEFDHIDPSTKLYNVGQMASRGYSIKKIDAEVAKCRIICANCHRKHTAGQFEWYRNLIPLFK